MPTLITRPLFIAVTGLIICSNSYTAHYYLDAQTPAANTIFASPVPLPS